MLYFRNPLTAPGAIGSAIAISGVLLYSLAKARHEKALAAQVAPADAEETAEK